MKYLVFLFASLLVFTSCKSKNRNTLSFYPPLSQLKDSGFYTPDILSDTGWISLFDGKSISQWHTYGKKDAGHVWNTDSGSIHLQPGVRNGYQTAGGGDLVSNDSFANFDFKIEWKTAKKANSGILFYVQENPLKYKETWNTGPEMQVCDNDSNEDSHSFKHEAGNIYDLIAAKNRAANSAMEWNRVEIVSNHNHLDLYLNDVHIISTMLWDANWKKLIAESKFKTMPDFGIFHSGHIALQDHGEEVWYRNISIKKIE